MGEKPLAILTVRANNNGTMTERADADIEKTFHEAEQVGLKLAIKGRFVAIAAVEAWLLVSRSSEWAPAFLAAGAVFAGLGVLHYLIIGSRHDRPWVKYVFITIDIVLLSAAVAHAPLTDALDLPKVMVFRFDLFPYYFLIIAVAAFSFSPGMVLWAGVAGAASWMAVFFWVVAPMERVLEWGDIPAGATGEQYLSVVFDADFIATGSRVQESVVFLTVAVLLAIVMRRARQTVRQQLEADAERRSISEIFGRYVPRAVADRVISDKGALAPVEREATVMFIDVAGFTELTERFGPTRIVDVLNAFFDAATRIIGDHNGIVTQFQGDAVLATFNVPIADQNHAGRTIECARKILQTADTETFGGTELSLRIGINTGSVIAGNVGGGGRQNYTVHGDAVNLAARLESMNKELGTRVLISESTALAAGRDDLTEVARVQVRGLSGKRPVFTVSTAHALAAGD